MSESLPPWKNPVAQLRDGTMPLDWRRWVEGVDRFIGTPPEEGSTGTAANYDVGTSGGRVPVLAGGTATQPNLWSGYNVFALSLVTQTSVKVQGIQVVGPQEAAVADAVDAAAAPTQAEFNALVAQFNALLARLRSHGLIAT